MKPESKKKVTAASCYDLGDLAKALDTIDEDKPIGSRPIANSTFDLSNLSRELPVVNAKLRESGKLKKDIEKLEWRQNELDQNSKGKGKNMKKRKRKKRSKKKKKTKDELIAKSRLIIESLDQRLRLIYDHRSQSIMEYLDLVSDPKADFLNIIKKFRRRHQDDCLDKLASPPDYVISYPQDGEEEEGHSNLHSDLLHQVE